MTNAGYGSLEKFGRMARLVAGALLVALVLGFAFAAGPAGAAPGDCSDPTGCDGGGDGGNAAPTVSVSATSYTVNEGNSVTLSGAYNDADAGDIVTVTVDANNDGTYESDAVGDGAGSGTWSYTFSAGDRDGPGSQTVKVKAADTAGAFNTASTTVDIWNTAPTATFNAPDYVDEGSPIALSLTSGSDPSLADRTAGFTYAFDCGAGYGAFSSSSTASCPTTDNGTRMVKGRIRDKDGGVREYTDTVTVNNVAPTATFNAEPASVNEGSSVTISFTNANDVQADKDAGFSYAFNCGNGAGYVSASTASMTCTYDDGNSGTSVGGKIIDKDGGVSEYMRGIFVFNVAPTATFNAPDAAVNQGANFTISLENVSDPSSADSANLTYAFDCGNGSGYVSSSTPSKSCTAIDQPTLTVKGKVTDDDGGSNEYTANVTVNNVYPIGTIQINNGAATTNNPIVNLTLSATDPPPGSNVGQMRFRNENTQTWSVWEPYQTSRQWQLSDGNGTKTVFVEYKDNAGNVSQGTISDQIQLDTTFVPSLRINDVRVNERIKNAYFTVRLSAASQQTITVNYTTANGTAKAPADYATRRGTLTFLPGQTARRIAVPIKNDRRDERTEYFSLRLYGAANAIIADASGRGTIVDND